MSEGAKKYYFLDNVSNMYSEAFSYSIESSIRALYLAKKIHFDSSKKHVHRTIMHNLPPEVEIEMFTGNRVGLMAKRHSKIIP